ncbi:hypothetical protein GH5_02127 [Leishmania sp. Ghana 2012 LV757]|uniref:hypothetical protein n=1 Tax=Leishmania sp. Ghana 2012 LV757 TaxID=2803181 RepID=UPI001B3FA4A4|nr:hypothetical protein GH5_02127 [Leishmania sp. Ghana 2012 LV757]
MDSTLSLSAASERTDPLLARLQEAYTRQKRQITSEKRKKVDGELQAAAAHCSDLPVGLELLSDSTVSLFNELRKLLECRHGQGYTSSREVELLQRIRQQTNGELRECMSFIEEGYRSGFQKLFREGRFEERRASLLQAGAPTSSTAIPTVSKEPDATASPAESLFKSVGPSSRVHLRDSLSASLGLMAESLAVLLQCEVVRVYLYDSHAYLQCVAQFPYRAKHADPMQSSYLAMMSVREVHHIVCHERFVVNGLRSKSHGTSDGSGSAAARKVGGRGIVSGLEDICTCLLLPIFSPDGAGKPYGMMHAVNKQFPTALGVAMDDSTDTGHVGFTVNDEILGSSVARVLGTILSRYPVDAFFASGIGERLRRSAFPDDAEVLSLTAHLSPTLQDEVQEAVEVAQLALSDLTPILVHRVPIGAIYEARTAAGEARRRKLAVIGPREGALSSVEFNVRCMNELWESSRADNVMLHKQYRALEEQQHRTRLLLRNLLDGVAAARAMPLSTEAAQFLHNLEMYGRSERTERMAAFVSDNILAIPVSAARGAGAAGSRRDSLESGSGTCATQCHMDDSELHALRNRHARLNTVTPASLHFDGPSGVRSYTSDPAQKREQVRFIDELCRLAEEKPSLPPGHRGDGRRPVQPCTFPTAVRATAARSVKPGVKQKGYPFERPFKL